MSDWLNLVQDGDLCARYFAGLLLIAVAQVFAVSDPRRYDRGVKITIAIGILFAGASLWRSGWSNAPEVMKIALRTGAVFMVLLGPTWMILSAWDWLANAYLQARATAEARAAGRRLERERRKQEAAERERKRIADAEWERTRPQRELEAKLAAERQAAILRLAASETTRRENARAACELLYAQHAPEIVQRFPRSDLDRFLRTYLGDTQPVDEVERRGLELQQLIHQHRQRIRPDAPQTIQALADWYLAEKTRIEALPLDDDLKQTHRMQLDYRYAELSEEVLQRAQP